LFGTLESGVGKKFKTIQIENNIKSQKKSKKKKNAQKWVY